MATEDVRFKTPSDLPEELAGEQFMELMDSGAIKRFHIARIIGQQTNAEHSWAVATIISCIAPEYVNVRLLQAALWHDAAELKSGDIPAPAKAAYPLLREASDAIEMEFNERLNIPSLSEVEYAILKFADTYDCIYFCVEQELMGNRKVREVVTAAQMDAESWLRKLPQPVQTRANQLLSLTILMRPEQ